MQGCVYTKKSTKASLVKMTLWTFAETQITNIEIGHDTLLIFEDSSWYAQPIWQKFLPVYHKPSIRGLCFISILGNLTSTKVHKAIFTSEMLGIFLVSSQACNSSDNCVTQIINIPKKILCSADKNYRSFFSLGQSLAIGLLTHISRYGIFKCIFKNIFTI